MYWQSPVFGGGGREGGDKMREIRNETVFAIAYMVGFACGYYSYQYPQVVEKMFFAILYAFSIVGVIALVIILFVLWRNRHVSPKG